MFFIMGTKTQFGWKVISELRLQLVGANISPVLWFSDADNTQTKEKGSVFCASVPTLSISIKHSNNLTFQ